MAGNWKMHKTVAEAAKLARSIKKMEGVEVVLCPPFTAISSVSNAVADSGVKVGAQNMYWEEKGAFTGEISPVMLKEFCQYVILGHSERRQYFGETNETVNKKALTAFKHGLIPIICCGESLEQNEAGETVEFVGGQIHGALADMTADQASKVVIAYEPIWAIGTGKSAKPEAVNDIIRKSIRDVIADMFDESVAQAVRVQYGGSVKPDNVVAFMGQSEIDGALVGGASLKPELFMPLVEAAAKS